MSDVSYQERAREIFERVYTMHQFHTYTQPCPLLHCTQEGPGSLGFGPLVWLDRVGRVCVDIRRCFILPEQVKAKSEPLRIRVLNSDDEEELIGPIPRAALLGLTNPELAPIIALRRTFQGEDDPVTEERIEAEFSEALGRLYLKRLLQEHIDSWLCGEEISARAIRRGIEQHFYFKFAVKQREQVPDSAFERYENDREADRWLVETASVRLLNPCLSEYGAAAILWFVQNKPYEHGQLRVSHLPRYVRRAEEFLEIRA
jgi:hypothetical protein